MTRRHTRDRMGAIRRYIPLILNNRKAVAPPYDLEIKNRKGEKNRIGRWDVGIRGLGIETCGPDGTWGLGDWESRRADRSGARGRFHYFPHPPLVRLHQYCHTFLYVVMLGSNVHHHLHFPGDTLLLDSHSNVCLILIQRQALLHALVYMAGFVYQRCRQSYLWNEISAMDMHAPLHALVYMAAQASCTSVAARVISGTRSLLWICTRLSDHSMWEFRSPASVGSMLYSCCTT